MLMEVAMFPAAENEPYPPKGLEPEQVRPPTHDTPPPPPPPAAPPVAEPAPKPVRIRRTRAGSVWVGLTAGGIFLVVLLIFVVQNTESFRFGFLGWHFDMPVGVAILVAACAGLLVMAMAGGVRIIQLRQQFTRVSRANQQVPPA
ncbi:lipopolysaccharide assembly LapA domain-containing protein [Nocardia sp. NPDC058058]|uniref:LapA family protein n=1 Tax=Nocardia sp. NPDC058058 TaxID=3346317 RepID=UPI0036DEA3D3